MVAPTICTIVAMRRGQSSVSKADENQEKFIRPEHCEHAQQQAGEGRADMAFGHPVRELVGRLPDGDDKHQVVQQLQRGRRAPAHVRVAPRRGA
jgi:hypothetical protein